MQELSSSKHNHKFENLNTSLILNFIIYLERILVQNIYFTPETPSKYKTLFFSVLPANIMKNHHFEF